MKANELRIGNLVSEYVLNECNIFWIGEHNAGLKPLDKLVGYTIDYRNINPIPLTEEWLLKFGFEEEWEEDNAYPYYYKDDFYCDHKFQPTDVGFKISKIEIQSVHQLQNLYFALTGKELEKKVNEEDNAKKEKAG